MTPSPIQQAAEEIARALRDDAGLGQMFGADYFEKVIRSHVVASGDARDEFVNGLETAANIADQIAIQQDNDHGAANSGGAEQTAAAIRLFITAECVAARVTAKADTTAPVEAPHDYSIHSIDGDESYGGNMAGTKDVPLQGRNIRKAATSVATMDNERVLLIARRDPDMFRDVARAFLAPAQADGFVLTPQEKQAVADMQSDVNEGSDTSSYVSEAVLAIIRRAEGRK